jgi:thiol-disulfide isomerase/thioredoxin
MKLSISSLLLLCILSFNLSADDGKGIRFRNLALKDAVIQAKKENKFVFLHGYTDWCSYCKTMAETLYMDPEVAKFYNDNYVNIKMDMEKEGKDIAKKMRINSYPALVYFNNDGGVVHRAKGERKKPDFMELGRDARDPKRNLKYYENTFNAGKATREEAYRYLLLVGMAGLDNQFKLNSYLSKFTVEQLQTPEYWRFIQDFLTDPTLALLQRVIDNKKGFEAKFTADSVNNKITGVYISEMMKRVQRLDSMGYNNIRMSLLNNTKLDIAPKIAEYAELQKHKIKSDWKNYIAAAPAFVNKYCNDDAKRLNEVAQTFAERATEKEDLLKAEKWAKRSIELYDIYKYNMTLTSLQVKLQKKEEALVSAKHTLELGVKTKQDTKPLLLLIEKMEK